MPRPVHRKLITPEQASRRHVPTIILPRQAEPDAGYHVCRVIVDGQGTVCGKRWPLEYEAAYLRHIGGCARDHMDEIRAQSPFTRMPALDPNSWDPEIEEHMRGVGERMIEEGRLEVKPSERAGF